MKVKTSAAHLKAAMKLFQGVVVSRCTVPVLGMVKFDKGTLTGTNLDMQVEVTLPSVGAMKGRAAVDYRGLATIANHIANDEDVMVSEADGAASVEFNGSVYGMVSCPAQDFPEFPSFTGSRSQTGNGGIVAAMKRVAFAISNEETRYYLNGVAFVRDEGGSDYLAATDGHRLALMPLPSAPEGLVGCIVHKPTVGYLVSRKGEPNAITVGQAKAIFEYDGLKLSAKLIDGTYPDVFRVIPKDTVPYITFDRAAALRILRRAAAFVRDSTGVKLTASASGLTLTGGYDVEKFSEKLTGDLAGEPFEAGYRLRYLAEALAALQGDAVTLAGTPGGLAGAPALITSTDDQLRIVLMPMRF